MCEVGVGGGGVLLGRKCEWGGLKEALVNFILEAHPSHHRSNKSIEILTKDRTVGRGQTILLPQFQVLTYGQMECIKIK